MARSKRCKFAGCMVLLMSAMQARADCIDDAARYQHVDPYVLRAIAYHESRMQPATINRNKNGTVDVGVMGINSVHFSELTGYGIAPQHLRDACVNAYVGAYYLRLKVDKYGHTWKAVAAYHSETPDKGAAYANAIRMVLVGWGAPNPATTFIPRATALIPD